MNFFESFGIQHQKGAMIALTALTLSLLFACTAVAVDLGNLYMHHSKLQNAADAAALAGAREYVTAKNTVSYHDDADLMAGKYVKKNLSATIIQRLIHPEKKTPIDIDKTGDPVYKVREKDDKTYYRVELAENVETYFLKCFGMNTIACTARGTAAISQSGGGSNPFDSLFIFERFASSVNAIRNPDNFNIAGQIDTTFDGKISYTDGKPAGKNNPNYKIDPKNIKYSTQSNKLDRFFTRRAKNEGLSVNGAISKGSTQYDERGDDQTNGYWTKESYKQFDFESKDENGKPVGEFGLTVKAMKNNPLMQPKEYPKDYKNYPQDIFTSDKNVSSSDPNIFTPGTVTYFHHDQSGKQLPNLSIHIDKSIASSDPNKPVYLYIDDTLGTINIDMNEMQDDSTGVPIIICYTGTGKVHFNLKEGKTFRGVIYAPNADINEGVLVNLNGGTFSGTIATQGLNLQGGGGTYTYERFDDLGGGSGNGSSSGLSISLITPPSNIDWN